jgi:hypothetical protein
VTFRRRDVDDDNHHAPSYLHNMSFIALTLFNIYMCCTLHNEDERNDPFSSWFMRSLSLSLFLFLSVYCFHFIRLVENRLSIEIERERQRDRERAKEKARGRVEGRHYDCSDERTENANQAKSVCVCTTFP